MGASYSGQRAAGADAARPEAWALAEPWMAEAGRPTLQQQVYLQLRHGLMVGRFLPGQTISLRSLARELGTSPMPVRKALHRLVAEHAVELLPNRTLMVARMTRARLREVSELREALEGMAAARACEEAAQPLLPRLEDTNRALLENIARRAWPESLRLNQQFHFTLYAAAGSETLMQFIEVLWLRAGPFMYVSLTAPDAPWDTSQHLEVLAGLRARAPERVRAAIAADIRGTTAYLLERVEVLDRSPPPRRNG